jgi:sulfatase maturation enzyme AslB (radical SAM superfamily)
LGGFCATCAYAEICRGGCTWTCYAEKGFVRDNPYCYWRQLHEQKAREAGEVADDKTHLPVVE